MIMQKQSALRQEEQAFNDGKPKGRTISLAKVTGSSATGKIGTVKGRLGPAQDLRDGPADRVKGTSEQGNDDEATVGRAPGRKRIVRSWNDNGHGSLSRSTKPSSNHSKGEEEYDNTVEKDEISYYKKGKRSHLHHGFHAGEGNDDRWEMES